MEKEDKGRLSPEEFLKKSVELIERAQEEGVTLRIIGGAAVRLHSSPRAVELLNKLGREIKVELDLVGLSKQRKQTKNFFESQGWKFDSYMFYFTMSTTVRNRYIFRGKLFDVDVFFDELDMCHKIDLRKRLDIDFPTLSLADLLLSKLQIVEFTEKDAKDVYAILRDHKIGVDDSQETINAKYIATLLADDWGFWYTATNNLRKLKAAISSFRALSDEDVEDIISKIDELVEYIDKEPKTKKWQKRAKVGTKKKWYKEVRI